MQFKVETKNYIIAGGYGSGKTSYINFLAGQYAFNFERIKMTYAWLKEFDEKHGIKNRVLPSHFVYSADKMKFQRVHHYIRESHDFDPLRFGLQKYAPKDVRVQWFPFGSCLITDEAYKYFPSGSDSDTVPYYIRAGVKIERHRGLDMYFIAPRFIDINKSIRDCCAGKFIVKKDVKISENKALIRWYIDEIPLGELDAYANASVNDKHLHSKRIVEECHYNVFKLYDAYSHCDDFDEGLENYDFIIV